MILSMETEGPIQIPMLIMLKLVLVLQTVSKTPYETLRTAIFKISFSPSDCVLESYGLKFLSFQIHALLCLNDEEKSQMVTNRSLQPLELK